ncbi:hypothetical protein Q8F55_002199 [Vanrija albida]|uniref:Very-long-chain (3R)-3-hydroxyacyl-CoA dehydratase n=1 Tax=Vanrija albida TaxID=181172 RepID=A0ABR3Q948_9TREE
MPAEKKHKKQGLTPVKAYLFLYNAVSFVLWARVLALTVWFIATPRTAPAHHTVFGQSARGDIPWAWAAALADHLSGAYDFHGLGEATKWTQSLAVLEIVHAALGLVRSPVGTVASQVFSRLWAVWGVVELVPSTHAHPLFTTMLLAWSVTETIRYPFYALALFNIEVYALDWLRYNTFLVLYPLGASSEAFLALSTVPPISTLPYIHYFFSALHAICLSLPAPVLKQFTHSKAGRHFLYALAKAKAAQKTHGVTWSPIQFARLVLFVIWWPALYVLYTYMLKQRRKFFAKHRQSKRVAGANKAN